MSTIEDTDAIPALIGRIRAPEPWPLRFQVDMAELRYRLNEIGSLAGKFAALYRRIDVNA